MIKQNNIKKITLTKEDGEEYIFEVDFPVKVSKYRGMTSRYSLNTGAMMSEPNQNEVLIIMSGPPMTLDVLFPTDEQIRPLIDL